MFPKMFLESLKQLPKGPKKQRFDFFGEKKIILGDKRLILYQLTMYFFFPSQDIKNVLSSYSDD